MNEASKTPKPMRPFTFVASVSADGICRSWIYDGDHAKAVRDAIGPLTADGVYPSFYHGVGFDRSPSEGFDDAAEIFVDSLEALLDWRDAELREREIDKATGRPLDLTGAP